MPTSEPFTLAASMTLPPDDDQPNTTFDYSFAGTFTHKVVQKLELSGSGSHSVGFGSIASPGAKAVFIEYLNNAASGLAAVNVTVNGGSDTIEITAGGSWFYCNPSPSSGITALAIAHTATCTLRVRLLQ